MLLVTLVSIKVNMFQNYVCVCVRVRICVRLFSL